MYSVRRSATAIDRADRQSLTNSEVPRSIIGAYGQQIGQRVASQSRPKITRSSRQLTHITIFVLAGVKARHRRVRTRVRRLQLR